MLNLRSTGETPPSRVNVATERALPILTQRRQRLPAMARIAQCHIANAVATHATTALHPDNYSNAYHAVSL